MKGRTSRTRPGARSWGWSLVLLVTLLGVPQAWAKRKNLGPTGPVQAGLATAPGNAPD